MPENHLGKTSEKSMSDVDELRIIQTVRQDPEAFGELYKRYIHKVFRYLYSLLGNVHEAEDITAQTFLIAFESFDKLRHDNHFSSWLFTIARNKATDAFRKRKTISSMDDVSDFPTDSDPLYSIIQLEQAAALSNLIRVLPEEDRELLRLRFLGAMSFPEMAHFLNRNEDAVKKNLYRLLARLQSQLEDSNE
jgi:RNA polymerase sigma-70 factor (ECF subfamily)